MSDKLYTWERGVTLAAPHWWLAADQGDNSELSRAKSPNSTSALCFQSPLPNCIVPAHAVRERARRAASGNQANTNQDVSFGMGTPRAAHAHAGKIRRRSAADNVF